MEHQNKDFGAELRRKAWLNVGLGLGIDHVLVMDACDSGAERKYLPIDCLGRFIVARSQ